MNSYDVIIKQVELALGIEAKKEYKILKERRWRSDYYIYYKNLHFLIEVEGGVWIRGRHNRGFGFMRDMEKYNTAAALGYIVLRFTPQDFTPYNILKYIHLAVKNKTEVK